MKDQRYPYALDSGTEIGGYVVEQVLGAGGFGITYRAANPVTGKTVAIKEFYVRDISTRRGPTVVVDSAISRGTYEFSLKKFEEEAKYIVARFRHKNIVSGENFLRLNNTAYLIMEFVEGRSFEEWLAARRNPPSEAELRPIIEQIFDAVDHIHSRDTMHRDLTPRNIMIRRSGEPVLVDFGTAGRGLDRGRVTQAVAQVQYAPPEQSSSEGPGIQGRYTDIFALGGVLYRAVSGSPPVRPMNRVAAMALSGRGGGDPYIPVARAAIDPSLYSDTFLSGIDRALEINPQARPQSIQEFRAALGWERSAAASERAQPRRRPTAIGDDETQIAVGQAPPEIVRAATILRQPRPAPAPAAAPPSAPTPVVQRSRSGKLARLGGLAAVAVGVVAGAVALNGGNRPDPNSPGPGAERRDVATGPTIPAERSGAEVRIVTPPPEAQRIPPSGGAVPVDPGPRDDPPPEPPAASNPPAQIAAKPPEAPPENPFFRRGAPSDAPVDSTEAAAAAGDRQAMVTLARAFDDGQGRPRDPTRAANWWEKAAAAGDPLAMRMIAERYLKGQGRPRDPTKAADWFEKAAEAGDVPATVQLALAYEGGIGRSQNYPAAARWLQTAHRSGDALAAYHLGRLTEAGFGVPADPPRAAELYEESARGGVADGMAALGRVYEQGMGRPQNPTLAAEWYGRAAARNLPAGLIGLGRLAELGRGTPQDYVAAALLYERAAAGGDPAGSTALGRLVLEGRGRPQDPRKAGELFERAAASGDAAAMVELARLYERGAGRPRDPNQAADWYERAADLGSPDGMDGLGQAFERGQGRPQDFAKAAEWYERAANLGDPEAMTHLGALYERGDGRTQDAAKAAALYQRAADRGDVTAMNNLGNLLRSGTGVPKDLTKAAALFEKAAGFGYAPAMANLGFLYQTGQGVPADPARAASWYEKAAAAGEPHAFYNLATLYDRGLGVVRNSDRSADLLLKALRAEHGVTRQTLLAGGSVFDAETRRAIQRLLMAEGFYKGPIDGDLAKARTALAKFEAAK